MPSDSPPEASPRWKGLAFDAAVLGLLVWALALAVSFPDIARRFPFLAGSTAVALMLIAVVARFLRAPRLPTGQMMDLTDAEIIDGASRRQRALAFAWVGVLFALMLAVGFRVGAPLFVAGYLFSMARIGWLRSVLLAAATAGVTELFLISLLGLRLPEGVW